MCLAPTFKNNFQNTGKKKKKKKGFGRPFLFLRFFLKKLQKVTWKICRLLFCVDNDKRLELMYLFSF